MHEDNDWGIEVVAEPEAGAGEGAAPSAAAAAAAAELPEGEGRWLGALPGGGAAAWCSGCSVARWPPCLLRALAPTTAPALPLPRLAALPRPLAASSLPSWAPAPAAAHELGCPSSELGAWPAPDPHLVPHLT